jgi:hypothetical protein
MSTVKVWLGLRFIEVQKGGLSLASISKMRACHHAAYGLLLTDELGSIFR